VADTGGVRTRYLVGDCVLDADLKAGNPWAKITQNTEYATSCRTEFEELWAGGTDLA